MWQKSFEKTYTGVTKEMIWSLWSDINGWSQWDQDLDLTELKGPFVKGAHFILKPKGGPRVKIEITEVTPFFSFTDVTRFPLAEMEDIHELEEVPNGVRIKNTTTVKGLLSWLWIKLVAQGVADGVPKQTDSLVDFARKKMQKN